MEIKMAYESAISFPMRLDSYGNIANTVEPGKIWADRITSVIGTMFGERVNRPNFGTKIANQWLNGLSGIQGDMESEIQQAFITFLPLLTLLETSFENDDANGSLKVIITYSLPNDKEETTVLALVSIGNKQPQYQENI
jgi:phage baseplate assembly protein W